MKTETFIEQIIDLMCNEHFFNLDQETKDKYIKNMESRYEVYMTESYNKGYYKGKIEGIEEMAKAISKSINNK